MSPGTAVLHRVRLLGRSLTADRSLEIALSRPDGFSFTPGQSIRIVEGALERDYSIASGPADDRLVIHVRIVENGVLTPILASAKVGRTFLIDGPRGYFTLQPSDLPVVLVATGTGAAPFLSMVRAGLAGFTMAYGVRRAEELIHPDELGRAAALFVPCISRGPAGDGFAGRVTDWARTRLAPGARDFYLCGRGDMIGEMETIVDERFPGSLVHTEIFY